MVVRPQGFEGLGYRFLLYVAHREARKRFAATIAQHEPALALLMKAYF
jgi:hypothetical protein